MLLPYNVDRVTRRQPLVTYSLIGANIVIFILTLLVSNLNLATDREQGRAAIAALAPAQGLPGAETEGGDGDSETYSSYRQEKALEAASQTLNTPDGYKRFWQIEHVNDSIVLEPHYSILNAFAYRPGEPSAINKLLTMFTALFIHGGIDHILGNMLFLWVFGRAIEDFLGRRFYLSTYFTSGVAATLMHHAVTMIAAPSSSMVPSFGASGAIAGVLGLFAVRFYRTKVRVFYLLWTASWLFFLAFFAVFLPMYLILHQAEASLIVALGAALSALFFFGRNWAWGAFRAPSVYVIGVWVVGFNLIPALWEMVSGAQGGVAYWAHIGGFACGAAYAALVGGVDEGKHEYALEDAQTALHSSSSDDALNRAGAILQKEADNPAAHEVAAQAYDRQRNPDLASQHYIKAIEGYYKANQRDSAARLYGMAIVGHPALPLRPTLLLGLSSHLAQNSMWNESAAMLTRIVEEHPQSPEAEIALLRAAQLWLRQYNDPAEALRMLELFGTHYPHSQWETQVKTVEKAAREILARQGGAS